jgi:uncharacterized UBP type Zn finger protein
MKDVCIYENPEKTIQVKITEESEKDVFGYKLPKQKIEITIDGMKVSLKLVAISHTSV